MSGEESRQADVSIAEPAAEHQESTPLTFATYEFKQKEIEEKQVVIEQKERELEGLRKAMRVQSEHYEAKIKHLSAGASKAEAAADSPPQEPPQQELDKAEDSGGSMVSELEQEAVVMRRGLKVCQEKQEQGAAIIQKHAQRIMILETENASLNQQLVPLQSRVDASQARHAALVSELLEYKEGKQLVETELATCMANLEEREQEITELRASSGFEGGADAAQVAKYKAKIAALKVEKGFMEQQLNSSVARLDQQEREIAELRQAADACSLSNQLHCAVLDDGVGGVRVEKDAAAAQVGGAEAGRKSRVEEAEEEFFKALRSCDPVRVREAEENLKLQQKYAHADLVLSESALSIQVAALSAKLAEKEELIAMLEEDHADASTAQRSDEGLVAEVRDFAEQQLASSRARLEDQEHEIAELREAAYSLAVEHNSLSHSAGMRMLRQRLVYMSRGELGLRVMVWRLANCRAKDSAALVAKLKHQYEDQIEHAFDTAEEQKRIAKQATKDERSRRQEAARQEFELKARVTALKTEKGLVEQQLAGCMARLEELETQVQAKDEQIVRLSDETHKGIEALKEAHQSAQDHLCSEIQALKAQNQLLLIDLDKESKVTPGAGRDGLSGSEGWGGTRSEVLDQSGGMADGLRDDLGELFEELDVAEDGLVSCGEMIEALYVNQNLRHVLDMTCQCGDGTTATVLQRLEEIGGDHSISLWNLYDLLESTNQQANDRSDGDSSQAEDRGACGVCKKQVTTKDYGRLADDQGVYYHKACFELRPQQSIASAINDPDYSDSYDSDSSDQSDRNVSPQRLRLGLSTIE